MVGINSLVGAAQRTRTEHDLIELERNGRTSVQVLAHGSEIRIPSDEVVVGDVVQLKWATPFPATAES